MGIGIFLLAVFYIVNVILAVMLVRKDKKKNKTDEALEREIKEECEGDASENISCRKTYNDKYYERFLSLFSELSTEEPDVMFAVVEDVSFHCHLIMEKAINKWEYMENGGTLFCFDMSESSGKEDVPECDIQDDDALE